LEDKASRGQTSRYNPVVALALKVRCIITFIDDLNLYNGYGVFLYVVDLGGLERKRERERDADASFFLLVMRHKRIGVI